MTCLVCRSGRVETFLKLGRQPVSSHFMAAADTPVVQHDLALAFCSDCGVVQIARPFPYPDLVPPYDWITYREPETHLDAVVETILKLPGLTEKVSVAGITFKDKTTLDRLRAHGFSKVFELDARADLGSTNPNANIESVQALLTPEKAKEIVARQGTFDLIIARHIAEHAEAPWRFMQALSVMLAPNGHLVVEVPDCSANLARQDYTMIWEEHVLYFTVETAPQILRPVGCVNLGLDVHPFPFEDVIVLFGRKSSEAGAQALVPPAAVARNGELARGFADAFDGWTQRYRAALDALTKGGRRLAGYGAGHLTCAFVNFHDLANYFAFVVDDTPHKQGLYLPKCKLPIVPRDKLKADEISACFLGLSPHLEDKIIANNAAYAEHGGRFHSMFVDSARSIRALT